MANVNVEKGKKGFQPTVKKPVSPTSPNIKRTDSSHTQQEENNPTASYDDALSIVRSKTENTSVPLMNRGARQYDSSGRVCRPSDTFNEWRAILYMQSRYPSMSHYDYRPSGDPFAPIDGAWYDSSGKLLGYSEIKSHPGKRMGSTTILNLRKWKKLLEQNEEKKTFFIAQYEDKIGWIEVDELAKVVKTLSPSIVHDRQSVQRSTSREEVWRIPTSALRIIDTRSTQLSDSCARQLEHVAKTVK